MSFTNTLSPFFFAMINHHLGATGFTIPYGYEGISVLCHLSISNESCALAMQGPVGGKLCTGMSWLIAHSFPSQSIPRASPQTTMVILNLDSAMADSKSFYHQCHGSQQLLFASHSFDLHGHHHRQRTETFASAFNSQKLSINVCTSPLWCLAY
jgi:hypothetical protein